LLVRGKYKEARDKARMALEYDLHSPIIRSNIAYVSYYTHDFKQAADEARAALRIFPYFQRANTYLAYALEQLGHYDEAIVNFAEGGDKSAAAYRDTPGGKWEEFLKSKEKLQRNPPDGEKIQYYDLAETAARLGKAEEALIHLRQAIDQRSNRVVFIGTNPRFKKLCGERFLELVREVKVPAKICGE
ncbi:MAG TPA: hypothetical protein VF611_10145, partial [Pyrinomonadaceae bacterium]